MQYITVQYITMYYNTIRGQNNKLPPFLQAICDVKGQINNLQREYKQPIRFSSLTKKLIYYLQYGILG